MVGIAISLKGALIPSSILLVTLAWLLHTRGARFQSVQVDFV